jgi:SAM-dependent methyltransferase
MKRPESEREFAAWNEAMVQRYDPDAYHTQSPLPVRAVEALRVRVVRRLLDAAAGSRVLEVGCGGGNVLEQMPGHRYGVDLSRFILEKARRRLGGGATLVRADATRLPFADASFDRVFCSEVLEHVLEPEAVVAEMRRVLRSDGIAVVSVPNEGLINRVKEMLFKLPLGRRLAGGDGGSGGTNGYHVPERMDDEWHLHAFSRARLMQALGGRFSVDAIAGVPSRLLPLRYVARLLPR